MKTIGLLLIFLSATSVGFIKASSYKETEKEINGFVKMIYFIKHEISFYLTPQNDIYIKFTDSVILFLNILIYISQYWLIYYKVFHITSYIKTVMLCYFFVIYFSIFRVL